VVTTLDLRVTYGCHGAKPDTFDTTALTNSANLPFEQYDASIVANWTTVGHHLTPVNPDLVRVCPRMIVVTSSALLPAAQTFAQDKATQGVSTVVETTDGPGGIGTNATAIRNYILSYYDSCSGPHAVPPSYVTLIGDTTQVPTFELSLGSQWCISGPNGLCPNFFEDPVATDIPYGYMHQAARIVDQHKLSASFSDFQPDLFVGRIPAASDLGEQGMLSQAQSEISAIVNYENAYRPRGNVTGTEYFQPCPDQNCGETWPPADASSVQGKIVTSSALFTGSAAYTGMVIGDPTGNSVGGQGLIPDDTTIAYENNGGSSTTWNRLSVPAHSVVLSAPASGSSRNDQVVVYTDTPNAPNGDSYNGFCAGSETVGAEAQALPVGSGYLTFNRVANDDQAAGPPLKIGPQYCDWDNNPTYMPAPAGVNWNGGPQQITQFVNAGTDLLWQIDHGTDDGTAWIQPNFGITDVANPNLTGFVPLVIGISCDTAKFDAPQSLTNPDGDANVDPLNGPSFGETWLEDGHAAAYIVASRQEPITYSGFLFEGLGSGLFVLREALGNHVPYVLPGGPHPPAILLPVGVGQLLATAKAYMYPNPVTNWQVGLIGTELEFNVLGDPSMTWDW